MFHKSNSKKSFAEMNKVMMEKPISIFKREAILLTLLLVKAG